MSRAAADSYVPFNRGIVFCLAIAKKSASRIAHADSVFQIIRQGLYVSGCSAQLVSLREFIPVGLEPRLKIGHGVSSQMRDAIVALSFLVSGFSSPCTLLLPKEASRLGP